MSSLSGFSSAQASFLQKQSAKPVPKFGLTVINMPVRDDFKSERENVVGGLTLFKPEIFKGTLTQIACGKNIFQNVINKLQLRSVLPLMGLKEYLGRPRLFPTLDDGRDTTQKNLDSWVMIKNNPVVDEHTNQEYIQVLLDEARLPFKGFLDLFSYFLLASFYYHEGLPGAMPGNAPPGAFFMYGVYHPLFEDLVREEGDAGLDRLGASDRALNDHYGQRYINALNVFHEANLALLTHSGIQVMGTDDLDRGIEGMLDAPRRDMRPQVETVAFDFSPEEVRQFKELLERFKELD